MSNKYNYTPEEAQELIDKERLRKRDAMRRRMEDPEYRAAQQEKMRLYRLRQKKEEKKKVTFAIHEQITPAPIKGCRYRIVENTITIDGVRSHLTTYCSDNLDNLYFEIERLESETK